MEREGRSRLHMRSRVVLVALLPRVARAALPRFEQRVATIKAVQVHAKAYPHHLRQCSGPGGEGQDVLAFPAGCADRLYSLAYRTSGAEIIIHTLVWAGGTTGPTDLLGLMRARNDRALLFSTEEENPYDPVKLNYLRYTSGTSASAAVRFEVPGRPGCGRFDPSRSARVRRAQRPVWGVRGPLRLDERSTDPLGVRPESFT